MIIAVCGQKVGRQDALRTIPLSKVRRPIEIRYDAFAGSARILCTHFCCPSGKVSERGRRSSGSCTSAQNRTFSAIPRNSYLCYFLRLKLQGIIYVSTAMAWNYLRFSLVSVKEFLYIECCRLTFIEMFIVWYSVFSNMLYTFLQYFNLYISV